MSHFIDPADAALLLVDHQTYTAAVDSHYAAQKAVKG